MPADDVVHGIGQTAGSVQFDDEALVVLIGGEVKRAGDIIGRGRADGAVNFDQPHLRSVDRHAEEDSDHRDEAPVPHKFPIQIQSNKNRQRRQGNLFNSRHQRAIPRNSNPPAPRTPRTACVRRFPARRSCRIRHMLRPLNWLVWFPQFFDPRNTRTTRKYFCAFFRVFSVFRG